MALRTDAPAQEPMLAYTILAVSLSGLVLAMLIGTSLWLRSNGPADSPPAGATRSPSESPAPAGRSAEPIAVPKETMTGNGGPLPAARGRTGAALASAPTLAVARLCRTLSTRGSGGPAPDWRCDPASRSVNTGALFFYTRLKSAYDTTVQHRWFRGDRLYQAVQLRIRANQSDGYRTYSRHTVDGQSAGDWRVELRSSDGMLLHEERFMVLK